MSRYVLTARTAHQVKQLLADGGKLGRPAKSGAPARGTTWVLVTGAVDGDGWYPAVVSIDRAGEFEDLTAEVQVRPADDGADLVEDTRYLCTRTGDADDGTARFRTTVGPEGPPGGVISFKHYVRAVRIGSPTFTAGSVLDGVTLATGDRVLVMGNGSGNGIYITPASGSPARADDADTGDELVSAMVVVSEGTVYHDTVWLCTTDAPITIGATSTTWIRFPPMPEWGEGGLGGASLVTDWTQYEIGSLILPGAGVWEVTVIGDCEMNVSAGVSPSAQFAFEVHDYTNSASVGVVGSASVQAIDVGVTCNAVGVLSYTTTASALLKLYASRNGGPTWVVANASARRFAFRRVAY